MMKKAVIAAAGLGTRMFPVTKAIEKAMLPLGQKPAIDYVVAECIDAGIEDIAIVVRPGGSQMRDYFGDDRELLDLLRAKGWESKSAALDEIARPTSLTFVEQPLEGAYGTAVPILLCREFIAGDPFVFVSGDDLLLHADGQSSLRSVMAAARLHGTAVLGHPAPSDELSRYGVLRTDGAAERMFLRGIAEKESGAVWDDPLINISRYALPASFVDELVRTPVDPSSGEHRLTDGLLSMLQSSGPTSVAVVRSRGEYFDLGSRDGWLAAAVRVAELEEGVRRG